MNINVFFAALSAVSALASATCAWLSLKTVILIEKNQTKEKNRPIIQIKSIITKLSKNNTFIEPDNNKRHYRITHGPQLHDVSINNKVVVNKSFTQDEISFFKEHRESISLHNFKNERTLIINLLPRNHQINSMVAEVYTNTITFVNHGAPIQSTYVNEAKILITGASEYICLKGIGQPFHTAIGKNEEFKIYVLEVSENFRNTICQMTEGTYNLLSDEFDLLLLETGIFLNYEKLEFSITFRTANTNTDYTYLYTFNNSDGNIYTEMTEIN